MICLAGLAFVLSVHQTRGDVVIVGDTAAVRCTEALAADLAPAFAVTSFRSGGPKLSVQTFDSVRNQHPSVVIVEFGSDQAHSPNWDALRDNFVPNLESLVQRLRDLPEHPRVLLCTPPLAGKGAEVEVSRRLSEQVVPLVRQAARELACPIADLAEAISDRIDLMDGIYPSKVGAELLAEAMDQTIATGRKAEWKVVYCDSQETDEGPAKNAIDGDLETYWHTNYSTTQEKYPHELQVDTGSARMVGGFSYYPRQDGENGRVAKYEFYLSMDGKDWGQPVATGRFKSGGELTKIIFEKPVQARYFRFRALSEQKGQPWASVAELDLLKFYPKRP